MCSALALPATLICIADDWFLRPRRTLSVPAGAQAAPDATWLRADLGDADAARELGATLLLSGRVDHFAALLIAIIIHLGLYLAYGAI